MAHTLAEARLLCWEPPDAIILDLMLPDGDGATLLQEVRAASLPTRVVITTGVNDDDRLAAVIALKPDALLCKPVTLHELLRALGPAC